MDYPFRYRTNHCFFYLVFQLLLGGSITAKDLTDYKTEWQESVVAMLGPKLTLHTAPLPGAGVTLAAALQTVMAFEMPQQADKDVHMHR